MARSWAYGLHTAHTLLQREPQRVLRILVDETRLDRRMQAIIDIANQHGLSLERVTTQTLNRVTDQGRHQGVALEVTSGGLTRERDLEKLLANETAPLVLVLDNIQDPHNLGAVLRSAAAAGVHAVVLPSHHASPITAVTRKVASGAVELLSIVQVSNVARVLTQLGKLGIWRIGTSEHANQDLFAADLTGPIALVLGSEGGVLRRLTQDHCDFMVRIPTDDGFPSLNVSVAAGVCLFEARRQRLAR